MYWEYIYQSRIVFPGFLSERKERGDQKVLFNGIFYEFGNA